MVVGALVGLLGVADAAVSALLADEQLPPIRQPFHSGELFARIGKVLINSAGEATVLIAKMCGSASERREPIAGCLWRLVADRVNELRCYDHFNLMLDNIYALENCVSSAGGVPEQCHRNDDRCVHFRLSRRPRNTPT